MNEDGVLRHGRRVASGVGAIILVAVILWIDVSTDLWNEWVILAGLAAGLVTFILTVLVLDKVIARSTARRWAPVTRLALTEFLHAIADDERSEISRGEIVPRALPEIGAGVADRLPEIHALRELVVDERARLADVLSRWTQFLASSGDNEATLIQVADIALQLDLVRDAALEAEHRPGPDTLADLNQTVRDCNAALAALESELQARLVTDAAARRRAAAAL